MEDKKVFSAEIDAQAIIAQYEQEQIVTTKKPKMVFDTKNYLNVRLAPGEDTKTLTIRLLPFSPEGGTCFKKVHMHTVRVNKGVSPSGWKTFVCPINNKDDNGDMMGESCPFCEMHAKAREMRFATTDEAARKKFNEVEFMSRPKDMWIVRCIERGHEEDGVKFWLFSNSKKKDGVYDDIFNLFTQRRESAARKGNDYNLFSLENGEDLIITLTKTTDGKTSVKVIDEGIPSKLSEDREQAERWVHDDKKWYEVYTVKPYEYMEIIAKGGIPMYNKELGKYVDKAEIDKAKEEATAERIQSELREPSTSFEFFAHDTSLDIADGDDFPMR